MAGPVSGATACAGPALVAAITERSDTTVKGLAVKGLTVALRDAMTQCGKPVMTKTTGTDRSDPPIKPATQLVTGGREANHGFVNPAVHHVSTVLYPTAEDFLARRSRYTYGRRGTPTSEALESAIRELEGPACAGVALLPSGLGATASRTPSTLPSASWFAPR